MKSVRNTPLTFHVKEVCLKPFLLSWRGETSEEVIRLAISLGGDSDTIAAMAGGIAEAYYGCPKELSAYCYGKLPPILRNVLNEFEAHCFSAINQE